MHWGLDVNLLQDKVKRKSAKAARNLDTIQRIVCTIFSAWKGRRRKKTDKKKGLDRTDETYLEEFYPADTIFSPKMGKIDFKKKITV